jgi:hypothetical protein
MWMLTQDELNRFCPLSHHPVGFLRRHPHPCDIDYADRRNRPIKPISAIIWVTIFLLSLTPKCWKAGMVLYFSCNCVNIWRLNICKICIHQANHQEKIRFHC